MNGASDFRCADALELAQNGVAVFPCGEDKRPLVATGFKAATTDPTTVANWWNRWPAALIGVPTGAASGLDVVDLDINRDTGEAAGEASLLAAGFDPAGHPHAVRTRSGGRHLFFAAGDLRTTAGALPGVDVRSCGGYVIAWSPGAILDAAADPALAAPPAALVETLRRRGKPDPAFSFDPGPRPAGGSDRWAQAALEREIAAVRTAPQGQRNATLNKAAFALAQVAAGGGLDPARVQADLMAAAQAAGLSDGEARATIRSGMTAGAQEPRTRPERADRPQDGARSDPGDGGAAGDPCGGGASTGGTDAPPEPPALAPTRFTLRDPAAIPPRGWLYGGHLIAGFVSLTVSPGGLGKSSLALVEALAMATGRNLIGAAPPRPLRVWAWNGEDPRDEIERRLAAACLHYGIRAADLDGRLFTDSGRDMPITWRFRRKPDGVSEMKPDGLPR